MGRALSTFDIQRNHERKQLALGFPGMAHICPQTHKRQLRTAEGGIIHGITVLLLRVVEARAVQLDGDDGPKVRQTDHQEIHVFVPEAGLCSLFFSVSPGFDGEDIVQANIRENPVTFRQGQLQHREKRQLTSVRKYAFGLIGSDRGMPAGTDVAGTPLGMVSRDYRTRFC